MQLFKTGLVSFEEAKRNSSNPGNFALRVQGISSTSDSKWDSFEKQQQQQRTAPPRTATVRTPSTMGRPASSVSEAPRPRTGSTTGEGLADDLPIERRGDR